MPIGFPRRATALAALAALFAAGGALGRVAAAPASGAAGAPIFSASQATAGGKAYAASCAACHGEKLEGGAGPALSGPTWKTLTKNTKLTVSDLYQFVSQQMPMNAPASLPKDQYVAIIAYILKTNGYPAGSKPMSVGVANTSKMGVGPLKGQ